jgi:Predicted membrane protein (DUF2339)
VGRQALGHTGSGPRRGARVRGPRGYARARVEARPTALAWGFDSIPEAVGAVALVLLALAGIGAAYAEEVMEELAWAAAALAVYLASGLVVDLAGAHAHASTQTSQLALSGFWGGLGFAAIVAGLIRHRRALRLGGLGVLMLAVGKVFPVDLAHLQVDLARGVVPRDRPAAARRRVRLPEGSRTVAA